jgi:hypothetical protein
VLKNTLEVRLIIRTDWVRAIAYASNRTRWLAVVLLSVILHGQDTTGRVGFADWVAARKLVGMIQTGSPALSENERRLFLSKFAELQDQRKKLEVDEENLVAALSVNKADLKKHTEASAEYEKDRADWQVLLAAHNARCNRTFTDPADVARCDKSGEELGEMQKALDLRQEKLAERLTELRAKQAEDGTLVNQLDERSATLTKRLKSEILIPAREALDRKPTTLRLTVKSFINVVDLSSMNSESRPRAEQVFAAFTNGNFSENPETPSPNSKDFRLWSQVTAIVGCRADTITSWKTSRLAHRGGKELRLLDAETSVMEGLTVAPAPQGTEERASLVLSYGIKGKPNDAALPSFRFVNPRTCENIWHRVQATVTCREGKAEMDAVLSGSQFPSHRVWTNGDIKTTISQGAFAGLWDCDPSAPERVR